VAIATTPHAPPHAGIPWQLAPADFVWYGTTGAEICQQLRDQCGHTNAKTEKAVHRLQGALRDPLDPVAPTSKARNCFSRDYPQLLSVVAEADSLMKLDCHALDIRASAG